MWTNIITRLFHRSCRIAPLIHCDYCPLCFHADCLDPPLTNPPSGRWMCPNHAERKLVNNILLQARFLCFITLYVFFSLTPKAASLLKGQKSLICSTNVLTNTMYRLTFSKRDTGKDKSEDFLWGNLKCSSLIFPKPKNVMLWLIIWILKYFPTGRWLKYNNSCVKLKYVSVLFD